jgi:hypothetical protein
MAPCPNQKAPRDPEEFRIHEFSIGEFAGSKKTDQTQGGVADLKRKIRQSEQIIAAHEKRHARRPRATDRLGAKNCTIR